MCSSFCCYYNITYNLHVGMILDFLKNDPGSRPGAARAGAARYRNACMHDRARSVVSAKRFAQLAI
eukprot:COSAG02_NODE_3848_length_6150_cov_2.038176_2_plen_66_part_00